ncbi:MAG TPA: hypothetical protein VGN12_03790 [Pirellulales bacterium]|jgi:hypothetical protein
MELRLEQFPGAEIAHYASKDVIVTTFAQHIRVRHQGQTQTFTLPVSSWERPLLPFRLLRRGARLDKCNVVPRFQDGRLVALVAIRHGHVYRIEYPSGDMTETLRLKRCRVTLHQSICETPDGDLYFGEYGANKDRQSVPLYRSRDDGRSWEMIYEFPAGSIKHIHGCFWDPYEERVWVCTGDFENENVVMSADKDFKSVEKYGDGSQCWRTCAPIFLPDAVVWGMDSQLETSHCCRFDRKTKTLEKLQPFPGPIWYVKQTTDGWYVTASSNEIGVGVLDDCAHIFASRDALDWKPVYKSRKDRWSKRWLKFGVFGFADGPQSSQDFWMFAEALVGLDGRTFRCALVPDGTVTP